MVVDAVAGVQVVTEKVWDYCTEYDLPRAIVVNWMDRELADFGRALASVEQAFGRGVVPLQLPIGAEKNFKGVIDLITMKALLYTQDGDGRAKVEEIPAELAAAAKEAHEKLVEMVAEGDDKLMEEFFEEGTLPVEDLMRGLEIGVPGAPDFPDRGQLGAAQRRQRRHSEPAGGRVSQSWDARQRRRVERGGRERVSRSSARSPTPNRFRFLFSRRSRTPSQAASTTSR